jgi:hypothetical protein
MNIRERLIEVKKMLEEPTKTKAEEISLKIENIWLESIINRTGQERRTIELGEYLDNLEKNSPEIYNNLFIADEPHGQNQIQKIVVRVTQMKM